MKQCPHCKGNLMRLCEESTVENAVFRKDSHFICKTCRRESVETQVWIQVWNSKDAQRPAITGGL